MTTQQEAMNPEIARKLLQVGEAFRIPGPFFSYEEIKMGNVNHTYKVNYIRDDGSGMAQIKSYLVQRVNTYAFQDPVALMSNIDKVTEYIHHKFPETKCLHFHHTAERSNYLMDQDGFWRLSNYVPSVTFNSCDDLNVVRSAGEAFGDFQMMLSDFDAGALYYTIPDFHNTRKRYEKLKADMAADPCGRVAEVRAELDWLLSAEDEACRLTDMQEQGELPLRVTHNDTKINNVLFDEATHQPLVVIDLDTRHARSGRARLRRCDPLCGELRRGGLPAGGEGRRKPQCLLGVCRGLPEEDGGDADRGRGGDAREQLLHAGVRAGHAVSWTTTSWATSISRSGRRSTIWSAPAARLRSPRTCRRRWTR